MRIVIWEKIRPRQDGGAMHKAVVDADMATITHHRSRSHMQSVHPALNTNRTGSKPPGNIHLGRLVVDANQALSGIGTT